MSKKDYYSEKEKIYPLSDHEAILRYNRAIKISGIKKNQVILDVGCKYAILNDILKEQNILVDYFGVDITSNVFRKIKGFQPEKFVEADISKKIPFPDNKFDYIFALEIMEHVEFPTRMLSEIKRVLKDDGVLILSVPNVYCWNEMYANIAKKSETEGHISAFTFQIMERLLQFNNLYIEDRCGTYFRVPFSKRILKDRYFILPTNNIFLSVSYIYKIKKLLN